MLRSRMSNGITNQLLANICVGSFQSTDSKIITLYFQNGAQLSPQHWPGSGHLNFGEGGIV